MKVSRREAILLLSTCAVAIYGGTAIVAKPRLEQWQDLRRKQADVRLTIEQDERLITTRPQWEQQFAGLRDRLPQYPADAKMDIQWLQKMDTLAARHGVAIKSRQVGEEEKVGDLYELPIECRSWESSLDGLVHFLFDLQSEGAMLDIRELAIKPTEAKSLRGRFVLNCAYTKTGTAGGASTNGPAQPGG